MEKFQGSIWCAVLRSFRRFSQWTKDSYVDFITHLTRKLFLSPRARATRIKPSTTRKLGRIDQKTVELSEIATARGKQRSAARSRGLGWMVARFPRARRRAASHGALRCRRLRRLKSHTASGKFIKRLIVLHHKHFPDEIGAGSSLCCCPLAIRGMRVIRALISRLRNAGASVYNSVFESANKFRQ